MSESGFQQSALAEQQQLPPERKSASLVWWLLILASVAGLVVVRWNRLAPDEPRGEQHPSVGATVTQFALAPLTGEAQEVTPGSLDGKVTLVNFWGPWCPACVVEFPHLVELERHFRDQEKFQFLSVSSNYNPLDATGLAESTAEFLKRQQADFPTYWDTGARTTEAFAQLAPAEPFGYPTTVLIGPDRRLLALWTGYVQGDERQIERAVEAALLQAQTL